MMESLLAKKGLERTITGADADQDRDKKAKAIIILCLQPNQLVHVRNKVSANEVWDSLKAVHQRESCISQLIWTKRLYNTKLKKSQDVKRHLDLMKQLFVEAEVCGVEFSEAQKCFVLLASLSDEWDYLIQSFQSLRVQDLSLDLGCCKVLEELDKQKFEKSQKQEQPEYVQEGRKRWTSNQMVMVTTKRHLCMESKQRMLFLWARRPYRQELSRCQEEAFQREIFLWERRRCKINNICCPCFHGCQ
nr:PREDICTED: uncharacterized protein LOC107983812 [Anolis carolinensis]|eukprot:XP_016854519.1 PREDICTED: uncharacterized protein LOC107983812 [Anolis carolinensis]